MIVVRAPFRVSFLGGGTDIPSHYQLHGGAVLSTSINRYIYLYGHEMFDSSKTLLKYSKTELVSQVSEIQHPIFREALQLFKVNGVDLGVSSDIPAGSGLGSSSSFTVALVALLAEFSEKKMSKFEIAELACKIELDFLKEPIGKQDQFAAALGGLNFLKFNPDHSVESCEIQLSPEDLEWLNEAMYLVKIPGSPRSASEVLRNSSSYQQENQKAQLALKSLSNLAHLGKATIANDGIRSLPTLLREAWSLKVASAPEGATSIANSIIELGLAHGGLGAKMLGAGGGGFVLFLVDGTRKGDFIRAFDGHKLLRVKSESHGVEVIFKEA